MTTTTRLTSEDLLKMGTPDPEAVALKKIHDATADYLYFGLGRNGTTSEDFYHAVSYLFFHGAEDYVTSGLVKFMTLDRFLARLVKRREEYHTLSHKPSPITLEPCAVALHKLGRLTQEAREGKHPLDTPEFRETYAKTLYAQYAPVDVWLAAMELTIPKA